MLDFQRRCLVGQAVIAIQKILIDFFQENYEIETIFSVVEICDKTRLQRLSFFYAVPCSARYRLLMYLSIRVSVILNKRGSKQNITKYHIFR